MKVQASIREATPRKVDFGFIASRAGIIAILEVSILRPTKMELTERVTGLDQNVRMVFALPDTVNQYVAGRRRHYVEDDWTITNLRRL